VITHLPNYSVRTGVHWQASGLDPEAVDAVTVLERRGNPMQFGLGEVDALGDAARDLLGELQATHDGRGVEVETAVRRGKPARTLLEYADSVGADVVVAGQRGADGITGALLGSTTDRLAHLADRPLVVVPAADRE
jgi:nucleotide-binding universal stress UspA family protein